MSNFRISKALSDRNRIRILEMLGEGDMKVSDVADSLDVEENLASHHLRVLATLGFLKSNKRGREVYYRINKTRFTTIIKKALKTKAFRDILNEALSEYEETMSKGLEKTTEKGTAQKLTQ